MLFGQNRRHYAIPWLATCLIVAGCSADSSASAPVEATPAAAAATPSFVPFTPVGALKPDDWPMWGGPEGNGISNESDWTSDWPAEGPKKIWTADGARSLGVGFSSCAVVGGRLYTLGHEPNTPEKEKAGELTDDTVWCFNAETGGRIWKEFYPCKQVANLHEGGPGATPTVDGNRLYTLSKEGHLYCFDTVRDGKILWKKELQSLLGVPMPEWGFSGSPRVLGKMLILDAGRVVALDKLTGKVIWQTAKYRPGYGSPTIFSVDGQTYVAVLNNDDLLIVRARDGSEVDKIKWETAYVTTAVSPIVRQKGNETSIFISGYRAGCALFDFKDGKLVKRYQNKAMSNQFCTCVLWHDVLYGIDGANNAPSQCKLMAVEYDSGKVLWKERGWGLGSVMLADGKLPDGKLIVLSDEGRLGIVAADPKEYRLLASAQVLDGKCWTMPVLSNGRIYCRNATGKMVCVDVRKSDEQKPEIRK